MSYQKLERASGLFARLKDLDDEIREITKMAMQLADGNSNVTLSLSVNKPQPPKIPNLYDPDGELMRDMMDYRSMMFQGIHITSTGSEFPRGAKAIDLGLCYAQEVTDSAGLQILAILLDEKRGQRGKMIEEARALNLA